MLLVFFLNLKQKTITQDAQFTKFEKKKKKPVCFTKIYKNYTCNLTLNYECVFLCFLAFNFIVFGLLFSDIYTEFSLFPYKKTAYQTLHLSYFIIFQEKYVAQSIETRSHHVGLLYSTNVTVEESIGSVYIKQLKITCTVGSKDFVVIDFSNHTKIYKNVGKYRKYSSFNCNRLQNRQWTGSESSVQTLKSLWEDTIFFMKLIYRNLFSQVCLIS